MRDFLDLFTHRIISLFYQAWRSTVSRFAYEGASATFSQTCSTLIGWGLRATAAPGGARRDLIYYSGLFALHTRSDRR